MYRGINLFFVILCFLHYIFLLFQPTFPIPQRESGPLYSFIPEEVGGTGLKTQVVCQQPPFLAFVFWKPEFPGRIELKLGFRECE